MAAHHQYFDPSWRTATFECPRCDFSGRIDELNSELRREAKDHSCPNCDSLIVVVWFPTPDDIRAAAREGDPEGLQMLANLEARESRNERWEQGALRSPDELPELEGDHLKFEWDDGVRDNERFVLIKQGDRLVWTELAWYEGFRRFETIREMLKIRYGARFEGLYPTDPAKYWLWGDDLSAPQHTKPF